MTADPRAALDRLVAALEAHYHALSTRRGDDDSAVDDAYDVLANAFDVYAEALEDVYDEETPFVLAEDDEDADDEGDEGDEGGDYDDADPDYDDAADGDYADDLDDELADETSPAR